MKTQMQTFARFAVCAAVCSILAGSAIADYGINWSTVDGGGQTFSSGGTFSLGGTVGQPDAGSSTTGQMAGGQFTLAGGFWAAPSTCGCMGDVNGDGHLNGFDIQNFANCLTAGTDCQCGDLNGANGVTFDDVAIFVQALLDGGDCQ